MQDETTQSLDADSTSEQPGNPAGNHAVITDSLVNLKWNCLVYSETFYYKFTLSAVGFRNSCCKL